MARLLYLKVFIIRERKTEIQTQVKVIWPNIQQVEKAKMLSDIKTLFLGSHLQTAIRGLDLLLEFKS